MSGTHVYYNGVLMRDCETLDYSCVLEYDESMTHEKYMKTRITVSSTLISAYGFGFSTPIPENSQHPSTIRIPSMPADETTPARMEEIMQLLSEPRKDFWYAVNGVFDPIGAISPTAIPEEDRGHNSSYRLVLISTGVLPSTGNEFVKFFNTNLQVKRVNVQDANNGPKPIGPNYTRIMGGNVVRVQATFEICRVLSKPIADADPGYDAQKSHGVICNSWNVTDSLDDDGAVTHSVSGKLVVKDQRFKPNAMRMFAFPLAFPYARLVDRKFTVDETGLVLAYQYQFKHAGAAPPQGIRKYEASFTESRSVGTGAAGVTRGNMSIKVMGWYDRSDNSTPLLQREAKQKILLIRGAYTILETRIGGLGKLWNPQPGTNGRTTNLTDSKIIERVGHPELELQFSVIFGDSNKTELAVRAANIGRAISIPGYDPRWWPIDNEWGRLPDGNGAVAAPPIIGNTGDKDNPGFTNAAYPYAQSGDPDKSDYFTGYFQPPGSNRHTLPRITDRTVNKADTSEEWARPAGSIPNGSMTDATPVPEANKNPISGDDFNAIPSKNLNGSIVLGPLPPVENTSFSGISPVQDSGFMYIAWTSEVMTDSSQGKLMLPLSVPRIIPQAKREQLLGLIAGNGPSISGIECSVPVQLCAPVSKRVYSVSMTRNQKWGQVPQPKEQIVRTTGSGSTRIIRNVETLLSKEILPVTPALRPGDGITREFELHVRYVYGLSNPWAGTVDEGGFSVPTTPLQEEANDLLAQTEFETLPVGACPIDLATAENNAIVVRGNASTLSPLFSSAQYG